MIKRFETILLEDVMIFLKQVGEKPRNKIFQNIERASHQTDPKLFKKLAGDIWEFRTVYAGLQYRLLAFWDKRDNKKTLVIATHGFVKKTDKVDKKDFDKANRIRQQYLNE